MTFFLKINNKKAKARGLNKPISINTVLSGFRSIFFLIIPYIAKVTPIIIDIKGREFIPKDNKNIAKNAKNTAINWNLVKRSLKKIKPNDIASNGNK